MYILIYGFYFFQFRRFVACGRNDAIWTEIALMRSGKIITGMQTINSLFHFTGFVNGLIYPVPYGTAYGWCAAFYTIPVFFQIADGISHGMCIFTNEHRFIECVDISVHPLHARIHFRIQITETIATVFFTVASPFVVHGAIVKTLGCIVACLEVASTSCFISQTPEYNAWMIAVAQYHTVNAIDEGGNPRGHVTDGLVGMVF